MKVLAFAASTSKKSINKQLVTYATSLMQNVTTEVIDMNDFEVPVYSQDKETETGIPKQIHTFLEKIASADALIISFAEHNGSYTAAYKNIFDWASRATKKVYDNKPVVLLSTSPGPRGASSVLESAKTSMPFFGAKVIASLSIPSFFENFDSANVKLKNDELIKALSMAVNSLK